MSGHTAITALLVLLYFVLLTWSLRRRGPELKGPWWFFLRAFFPNWKFFHAVGYVPHLYARSAVQLSTGELQWSAWVLIYPRRLRRLSHLVHNPDTNIGLAQQNMVDHFWADLHDLPEGADPRNLVSYQMMQRLSEQVLRARDINFTHRQFELRMVRDGRDQTEDTQVMMTSPIELSC